MATFHPFPRLPFELRAQIWEATVEPRTVEVRIRYKNSIPRLVSLTPVPAPLQTCREARNLKLYRQAFSELPQYSSRHEGAVERRYVWLNLDIDIISIGDNMLEDFHPVAPLIKRLKIERVHPSRVYHFDTDDLCDFVKLEEMLVVRVNGLKTRYWVTEGHD